MVAHRYITRRVSELGATLQTETRTNPLPDRDDTSGTADASLDSPAVLEVVDYKNGRVVVEVENNPQLLAYLCGRAHDTGWRHERYTITVVQPNAAHARGPVRSQTLTRAELWAFQTTHRRACELADKAEADWPLTLTHEWEATFLSAGEHCDFCHAAPTCSVRLALTAAQAKIDFERVPYDITELDDIGRAVQVYRWAAQIRNHIGNVEAYIFRAMSAGMHVPGFKLVQKNTARRWKAGLDPEEIVLAILEGGFVDDEAALYKPGTQVLKTGPAVLRLVSRGRRDEFEALFLERPEGELVVAPIGDSRRTPNH